MSDQKNTTNSLISNLEAALARLRSIGNADAGVTDATPKDALTGAVKGALTGTETAAAEEVEYDFGTNRITFHEPNEHLRDPNRPKTSAITLAIAQQGGAANALRDQTNVDDGSGYPKGDQASKQPANEQK